MVLNEELKAVLRLRYRREGRGPMAKKLLLSGSAMRLLHECDLPHDEHTRSGLNLQRLAIESLGITVLPVYQLPLCLQEVAPPVCLFVRGDPSLLHRRAVGIVGSRRASRGPVRWAAKMAWRLANEGFLVISGGARGIDSAAHRAALDSGKPTVVYLGVAVDRIYPPVNAPLFARILKAGGALVSEFAPGEESYAYDHARRNRFIAAHSTRLLLAEAATGSGSLGTAEAARRCGKPVMVPPFEVGGQREGIQALVEKGWASVESVRVRNMNECD